MVSSALANLDGAMDAFMANLGDGNGTQKRILLSTDYSGVGTFEMAGDMVLDPRLLIAIRLNFQWQ